MAKGMHIRKDDTVMLIAGKDKGKTGRVLRTEPGRRRVYVEGLNIIKRRPGRARSRTRRRRRRVASSTRRGRSTSPT